MPWRRPPDFWGLAMKSDNPATDDMQGSIRIMTVPGEDDGSASPSPAGTPRLLVVRHEQEPPISSDCCQDWMWSTGNERELRSRLQQLQLRALSHGHARPYLDPLGLLHVGIRSVALAPKQRLLALVLVESFNEFVPVKEVVRATWPEGISGPTVLATLISALRSRIGWVGLEITGSSTKGYLMRAMGAPAAARPAGAGGFEDELDVRRWLAGTAGDQSQS